MILLSSSLTISAISSSAIAKLFSLPLYKSILVLSSDWITLELMFSISSALVLILLIKSKVSWVNLSADLLLILVLGTLDSITVSSLDIIVLPKLV